MIINTKALKKALKDIAPVISSSPVVPILECVKIEAKDAKIIISGSDLNTSIKTTIESNLIDKNEIICLPFQLLNAIISKIEDTEIEITTDKDTFVSELKFGKKKAKISGENNTSYPAKNETGESKTFNIKSDILSEIIRKCSGYMSGDFLREAMMSINIEIKDGKMSAKATDGHKACIMTSGEVECEDVTFGLRRDIVMSKGLFDSNEDLAAEIYQGHYRLISESKEFESRLCEERFPDVNSIIPEKKDGEKCIIDRLELLKEVDRCLLFTDKQTKQIALFFKKGILEVSAIDMDFGNEYRVEIPCDYNGDEIEIGLNAVYLKLVIQSFDSEILEALHFKAVNRAVMFFEDDFMALSMPVMLHHKSHQANNE